MARKGNQQPRNRVTLPYDETLGWQAVKLYERTGRKAQPWQVEVISDVMAINEKSLWAHTRFGYSLPRRNGKNEVVAMREIWGLVKGDRILHTAHRTTTSHAAWERLLQLLDDAGIQYLSLRATGRERIDIPETGGRIEFRTRTSKGGLGEGFDLLVVDEAQEYTDDQESALKYIVTDSYSPQTILCGTPPTPLSAGTVFTKFRDKALEGGAPNVGWVDWSVDEVSNPKEKDLWYLTNPSLGTIFTERSVEDELGTDEIDFNIQRLGLWIKYNQKSAITITEWASLKAETLPALTGKLYVGIKYGNDGTNVAMSLAVKTADEKIFVESIDCRTVRAGAAWVVAFLKSADIGTVVIDGASGQNLLAAEMKEARLKPPILPTVKEIIVANSTWEQAIFKKSLTHKGQPSLTAVATNCDKRNIGSNGGFGYRSQLEDYDIALMDSAILAHWACSEAKPPIKQKIRY